MDIISKDGFIGDASPASQQYSDTCAIKSQQLILQDFGIYVSEDDLIAWSTENGLYTGNGTRLQDIGAILQQGGIPVSGSVNCSVFDLVGELSQGHKVIVGVDSGELWDQGTKEKVKEWWDDLVNGEQGADHALIVAGIDNANPENPQVLLTDPGTGEICKRYSLDQFMDAWRDSDCFMVSTDIAPVEFSNHQITHGHPAMHLADIGGNSYSDFLLFHYVAHALPDMSAWDYNQGLHPVNSLTQAYLDYAKTDDLASLLNNGQYDFMSQVDPGIFISAYSNTYTDMFQNPAFSNSGIENFLQDTSSADMLSDCFHMQASNFEAAGDSLLADFFDQQAHYMDFCQAFGINPADAYSMDVMN